MRTTTVEITLSEDLLSLGLDKEVVSLLGVAAVSLRATVGSEAIPSVAGRGLLRRCAPRNDKSSPF
jgi:hypothetical protein